MPIPNKKQSMSSRLTLKVGQLLNGERLLSCRQMVSLRIGKARQKINKSQLVLDSRFALIAVATVAAALK